jgi:hypothetical protein
MNSLKKFFCWIGLHSWSRIQQHQRVPMMKGTGIVFLQECLCCPKKVYTGKFCSDQLEWKNLGELGKKDSLFRPYQLRVSAELMPGIVWFPTGGQPVGWKEVQ